MYRDVLADPISQNVATAQWAVASRLQPVRKCGPARAVRGSIIAREADLSAKS